MSTQPFWKTTKAYLKRPKAISFHMTHQSNFLDIYYKSPKIIFKKDICTPGLLQDYSNSQNLEITQVSKNKLNKETMVLNKIRYYFFLVLFWLGAHDLVLALQQASHLMSSGDYSGHRDKNQLGCIPSEHTTCYTNSLAFYS